MAQEIRDDTDWAGRAIKVIYEDGTKIAVVKPETTWLGDRVDRAYDTNGHLLSETTHETTLLGDSREVTRDTSGKKVSTTTYEPGLLGGNTGVIRQNGRVIGKLTTEHGVFGGRKQVLHGDDVDLTRRATSEGYAPASRSSSGGDCGASSAPASHSNSNAGTVLLALGAIGFVCAAGTAVICGLLYLRSVLRDPDSVSQPASHLEQQVSSNVVRPEVSTFSLEQNVQRLSGFLQANNSLAGNFNDYRLVEPPAVIRDANYSNLGNRCYDIAFSGPSLYIFHSSDGGVTWDASQPPTDPYIIGLRDDYFRRIRNASTANNHRQAKEVSVRSASEVRHSNILARDEDASDDLGVSVSSAVPVTVTVTTSGRTVKRHFPVNASR